MKKKSVLFVVINIIILAIFGISTYHCVNNQEKLTLNVYLGESHAGKNNIAQVFYSENVKKFKDTSVITQTFDDNLIPISIGEIDFMEDYLRLDPFNRKEDFSIVKVEVACGEKVMFSLQGEELQSYIKKTGKMSSEWKDGVLYCKPKSADPKIIMKKSFSKKIYMNNFVRNVVPCVIIFALYCIIGFIQIHSLAGNTMRKRNIIIGNICSVLSFALGLAVLYIVWYFEQHFGQVPFGQLLYHLRTPLDGTDVSSYLDDILIGIGIILIGIIIYVVGYLLLKKRQAQQGYLLWVGFLGLGFMFLGGMQAVFHFDIVEYYQYTHSKTTLYEDYYVDGREVTLTFPERKRNLIYIFLESMEITYADVTSGGAMRENYMPELTKLALDNNCFTEGTVLNGPYHVNGATYTMGALATQTCGVPINTDLVGTDTLNTKWDSENNYLPGV